MLTQFLTISLIITAVHVCTWDGMIFGRIAEAAGSLLSRHGLGVLRKPLYECLICMGGVWTLVLYPILYGISWNVLVAIPCVIGINTIISAVIIKLHEL